MIGKAAFGPGVSHRPLKTLGVWSWRRSLGDGVGDGICQIFERTSNIHTCALVVPWPGEQDQLGTEERD